MGCCDAAGRPGGSGERHQRHCRCRQFGHPSTPTRFGRCWPGWAARAATSSSAPAARRSRRCSRRSPCTSTTGRDAASTSARSSRCSTALASPRPAGRIRGRIPGAQAVLRRDVPRAAPTWPTALRRAQAAANAAAEPLARPQRCELRALERPRHTPHAATIAKCHASHGHFGPRRHAQRSGRRRRAR